MSDEIRNLAEAVRVFLYHIPGSVDESRRYGSATIVSNGKERYMIMFKRELYQSFKYHFPNLKKEDGSSYGYGQVMSDDLLTIARGLEIDKPSVDWLVFITPDRKIYQCSTMLFYKKTREMKTNRIPHLDKHWALPLEFFERIGV